MALTLVQAIAQVRSALNETYENYTELMPNAIDRNFTGGATAWANVDLDTFDETTDLSLAATAAADLYCTLAVASAPMTVGRRYRLYYDVSSFSGVGWTIQDFTGSQSFSNTVTADGARQYNEFTSRTPGGLRIVSLGATASNFDNFSLIDVTDGYWTDDEITEWIKEGTRLFCSKSLMNEAVNTIDPPIVSTPYYDSADETFIAGILKIYSAIYFDGVTDTYKGLMKIHPRQIGNVALSTAGPPKYYAFFDRKIYIFPMASAAVAASGEIEILYAEETDEITGIEDEFQHLPIIYATAKAKQKDMKYQEASVLMSQFFQDISFERADKHERKEDTIEDFRIKGKEQKRAR